MTTLSDPLIFDGDETFTKYDFSSIINDADERQAIDVIKSIIDSGSYFTNSPKYQTKENIFLRPDEAFLKLRMSFIFSCFMYMRREVKIRNIQAWSFMTNNEIQEDREKLWHTHQIGGDVKTLSGIYYLHIPDDADYKTSGTEFAPHGVEHPERLLITPAKFSWLIYPGKIWHRPTQPQSKNYRFIVAADMEF